MRPNLLDTLLCFASGGRPAEEDPITEVIAWLLAREEVFLDAFCDLLTSTASKQRGRSFLLGRPTVRTQVVIPRIGGGTSRYDLVLDGPRCRAVVEVKVRAPLTVSAIVHETIDRPRHQVDDYLALAAAAVDADQLVFTLAIGLVDVGVEARAHDRWGGGLTWQTVHDAFASRLRAREATSMDAGARMVAEQLLGVMEARGMATPKMTMDGALSVRRAARFRQSIDATLDQVWQELHADGTLEGFVKLDRRAFQDERQWTRLGYRLWTSSQEALHFGFFGLWYGDETVVEDVPDLCFFLQAKPDGRAGEMLREKSAEIAASITKLDAASPHVRWSHHPSEWAPIWCATSLGRFVLEPDPNAATKEFFREALMSARACGLLTIYFDAVKQLA